MNALTAAVRFRAPEKLTDAIREAASKRLLSVSAFARAAILEKLEREGESFSLDGSPAGSAKAEARRREKPNA